MARITVDDCIKYFPNRFELTLAATNRARQIALGATPLVEANKDKPTVIALREIAANKVGKELLKVIDPRSLRFEGLVSSDAIQNLQAGQPVTFRVNGYGPQVASLYAGMDLRKWF